MDGAPNHVLTIPEERFCDMYLQNGGSRQNVDRVTSLTPPAVFCLVHCDKKSDDAGQPAGRNLIGRRAVAVL